MENKRPPGPSSNLDRYAIAREGEIYFICNKKSKHRQTKRNTKKYKKYHSRNRHRRGS